MKKKEGAESGRLLSFFDADGKDANLQVYEQKDKSDFITSNTLSKDHKTYKRKGATFNIYITRCNYRCYYFKV